MREFILGKYAKLPADELERRELALIDKCQKQKPTVMSEEEFNKFVEILRRIKYVD